ncbi:MAG: hypothetical protein ACOYOF_18005 [Verrucomicrobiaceae bacterium]
MTSFIPIEANKPLSIAAPVEHITFTNAKYSDIQLEGDRLSIRADGLTLYRPYPQADPTKNGTTVKQGRFVFEGVSSFELCTATLKPDWQQRAGMDRFEPEVKSSQTLANSPHAIEFDIGAGYLLKDGKESEVRTFIVHARSLNFIPEILG